MCMCVVGKDKWFKQKIWLCKQRQTKWKLSKKKDKTSSSIFTCGKIEKWDKKYREKKCEIAHQKKKYIYTVFLNSSD